MTQTILDTAASAVYTPLITFLWGTSSVARYCRWTSDLTVDGQPFQSEPTLKILYDNSFQGGTDDSPISVEMDRTRLPFNTLSQPFPHSKCETILEEYSPGDAGSRAEIWRGRVSQLTVDPNGRTGVGKAKIVGVKSRLKGDLGMAALTTCIWPFGDRNNSPCGVTLADKKITGVVSALYQDGVNTRITISFSGSPNLVNPRWARGMVELDGCGILIRRSLDDGSGKFDLREVPPPDWVGQTVTLTPGCSKTIENCRYWNNEERAMMLGRAMPSRNPLFEE